MNKLDELALDGRLLQMLVAVHSEGSVTAAALALGVTQSTVSHGLNRLREITGDDSFVPMGRGITPTEKADALAEEARVILERMMLFSQSKAYDPASDRQAFTIAATDYEVEVIVKPFIHQMRVLAPGDRPQHCASHWHPDQNGTTRDKDRSGLETIFARSKRGMHRLHRSTLRGHNGPKVGP